MRYTVCVKAVIKKWIRVEADNEDIASDIALEGFNPNEVDPDDFYEQDVEYVKQEEA